MGAEQLEEQMKATLDQAVRGLCRSTNHNEAYMIRNANCEDLKQNLNRNFEHVGVEISDVIIQDVKLPDSIAQDLENKTLYFAVIEEQKKNQEYNTVVIKQNNDLQLIQQQKEQARLSYDEQFRKNHQDKLGQQAAIEAETHRQLARYNIKKQYETQEIKLDAELIATTLDGETKVYSTKEIANGKKQAGITLSQTQAFCLKTEMEAKAKVAEFKAKALLIESQAEGKAAEKLKAKRSFVEDMANQEVLFNLGLNQDCLISGKGAKEGGEDSIKSLRTIYYMQKLGYKGGI